jgi:1-deoxy-D-xylulose-5-phosphate reductoisomerase
LRLQINGTTEVLSGEDALLDVVSRPDVDLVISALVGFAGLRPTLCAIEAGKDVALANKETLVVGGAMIMEKVRSHDVRLLPVDSEHSAILQCLQGEDIRSVGRLILTASGGPFLHLPKEELCRVTPGQALKHPTWRMGSKITIDSATLMNKGLEVIEAHWLFGLPPEKIEVIIHPQSIIHSMVEFVDGSIKAQLGIPDMKLPIQYALTYPDRPSSMFKRVDFSDLARLTFQNPDKEKFPCLSLAYRALEAGGTAPAVLNAANEAVVQLFLEERISFTAIPELIADALDAVPRESTLTFDALLNADRAARLYVADHAALHAH